MSNCFTTRRPWWRWINKSQNNLATCAPLGKVLQQNLRFRNDFSILFLLSLICKVRSFLWWQNNDTLRKKGFSVVVFIFCCRTLGEETTTKSKRLKKICVAGKDLRSGFYPLNLNDTKLCLDIGIGCARHSMRIEVLMVMCLYWI